MITDQDKLRCAESEHRMRRYIYPHWVRQGRITQTHANTQIDVMKAIADDYRSRIDSAARNAGLASAGGGIRS